MDIIDVQHEWDGHWHKFTSPHVPGLYMIAEESDLEQVYSEIPTVIESLIEADFGMSVKLKVATLFSDYAKDLPAALRTNRSNYYTVEKLAA